MTDSGYQQKRSSLWFVFFVGSLVSMLFHWAFLDAPFVLGRAGEFGGRFQGAIQGVWHENGFFALDGRPVLWPIPTEPVSGRSYVHHPLLFHYLERISVWLFGLNEFALRIYPAIGASLTSGIISGVAFRRWGILGSLMVLLVVLPSYGMHVYGKAANYDSTMTFFLLSGICASRCLKGRRRIAAVFCCSFVAIGHEWSGGLLALGLVGHMVADRRFDWKVLSASLLGSAAYVVMHLSLVAHWEGSLSRAIEIMLMASEATGASETPVGIGEFLGNQIRFFSRMWGLLALPLIVAPIGLRNRICGGGGGRSSFATHFAGYQYSLCG